MGGRWRIATTSKTWTIWSWPRHLVSPENALQTERERESASTPGFMPNAQKRSKKIDWNIGSKISHIYICIYIYMYIFFTHFGGCRSRVTVGKKIYSLYSTQSLPFWREWPTWMAGFVRFVRDASGASHDCNISGSLSGVRPGESKELKITVPQRPEGEDFRLCPGGGSEFAVSRWFSWQVFKTSAYGYSLKLDKLKALKAWMQGRGSQLGNGLARILQILGDL